MSDPAQMRRRLLPIAALVLLAVPSTASADTGGAVAPSGGSSTKPTTTGGASFQRAPLLRARTFRVSRARWSRAPRCSSPGASTGARPARRCRSRSSAGGRRVATLKLGRRRTNRTGTFAWKPSLAPGTYTARLHATAVQARHTARVSSASSLTVAAPPVTKPSPPPAGSSTGVFPVLDPAGGGDGLVTGGAATVSDDAELTARCAGPGRRSRAAARCRCRARGWASRRRCRCGSSAGGRG